MIECSLEYVDFTPDGVHYYKGNESYKLDIQSRDPTYTANVEMFDNNKNSLGKMNFTVSFTGFLSFIPFIVFLDVVKYVYILIKHHVRGIFFPPIGDILCHMSHEIFLS